MHLLPRVRRFWREKGWANGAWVNRFPTASRALLAEEIERANQQATTAMTNVLAIAVALNSFDRYNTPQPPGFRERVKKRVQKHRAKKRVQRMSMLEPRQAVRFTREDLSLLKDSFAQFLRQQHYETRREHHHRNTNIVREYVPGGRPRNPGRDYCAFGFRNLFARLKTNAGPAGLVLRPSFQTWKFASVLLDALPVAKELKVSHTALQKLAHSL